MEEQVLSLRDIADLAHVRRPVVSVWRRRPLVRGEVVPFPEPISVRAGQEHFRLTDVLGWLERTGRGNNPAYRADAPAVVRQGKARDRSRETRAALEALLVVKAVAGTDLGSLAPTVVLDLADELDPDDSHLFSELQAVEADLSTLSTRADELSEACYGPAGALTGLARRRYGGIQHGLAAAARRLVARVAWSMATDAVEEPGGGDRWVFGGLDRARPLVQALLDTAPETAEVSAVLPPMASGARSVRRRLRIGSHGWVDATPPDGAVTHLLDLTDVPSAATAGALLDAVDDMQLGLRPIDRGLVLGPASLLTDALTDPDAERSRSDLLRTGRLQAAFRLPRGLLRARPTTALALWVFGPLPPGVALPDRWLAVADVGDQTLTERVVDDIVSDVHSAVGGGRLVTAHAFRVAHPVPTSTVLARREALVLPGEQPGRITPEGSSAVVVQAQDLLRTLAAPLRPCVQPIGIERIDVDRGSGHDEPFAVLATILSLRLAALLPGLRALDPALPSGSVPVVRVGDVVASRGCRLQASASVDLLALELHHGARRTEPGDLVFCTSPEPAAVVDREGGSVVLAPARVLRCRHTTGLVPEALAAAINALPAGAREWRTWRMPRVPTGEEAGVGAALRVLEDEREELRARHTHLDELTTLLTTGAARGALSLTISAPDAPPTEGP